MTFKTCKGCGEAKPADGFYKSPRTKDGLRGKCRSCTIADSKAYHSLPENAARRRELERLRGRDPETVKRHRLWTWFRITWEQYEEMLERQGGVCAICKSDEPGGRGRFHVDHDHSCCAGPKSCGKCVRGLLCSRCNPMVGMAQDNVDILRAAVHYLEDNALLSAIGAVGDV